MHGVKDNKSTETANQIFIENIQELLDTQLYILGLFFDLTKACDVINHEILLNRFGYYGIRGTIKAWIVFYLLYWSQFAEIFKTDKNKKKPRN